MWLHMSSNGLPGAFLISGIYDLLPILSTYVNEPLKMTEYVHRHQQAQKCILHSVSAHTSYSLFSGYIFNVEPTEDIQINATADWTVFIFLPPVCCVLILMLAHSRISMVSNPPRLSCILKRYILKVGSRC